MLTSTKINIYIKTNFSLNILKIFMSIVTDKIILIELVYILRLVAKRRICDVMWDILHNRVKNVVALRVEIPTWNFTVFSCSPILKMVQFMGLHAGV